MNQISIQINQFIRRANIYINNMPSWLLAVIIAYAIHGVFVSTFGRLIPYNSEFFALDTLKTVRPIKLLPNHTFFGWDGEHYRRLMDGYTHSVWPPLYPMILKFFGYLIPSEKIRYEAGVQIINFISHITFVIGIFAYSKEKNIASFNIFTIILLIFFFPGHSVFFAAYSESLFLALTVWAFVFYLRKKYFLAGILCSLSVLTRYMGIFLAGAFLIVEAVLFIKDKKFIFRSFFASLIPLATFFIWYFIALYGLNSDIFNASHEWRDALIQNHVTPGMNPKLWVLQYLTWTGPGNTRLIFYLTVMGAILLYRRKMHVEFVYVALFLGSFAISLYRPFPFTRFVSVLFPLVFVYASYINKNNYVRLFVVFVSIVYSEFMQIFLFKGWFGEP